MTTQAPKHTWERESDATLVVSVANTDIRLTYDTVAREWVSGEVLQYDDRFECQAWHGLKTYEAKELAQEHGIVPPA